jgi:GT2 family glycosyltransferase
MHKITNDQNVQVNKPLKTEEFLPLFLKRRVLMPSTTSLLVRREVAERIGGFEESFRGLFEDQVFIAKVSLEAPIVLLRGVYEWYRQHLDSCTFIAQKITGGNLKMRPTYLNWLEKYLSVEGFRGTQIWDELQNQKKQKALLRYRHPKFFRWSMSALHFIQNRKNQVMLITKRILFVLICLSKSTL